MGQSRDKPATMEKKERRMVHIPMGRFGEAVEQARAAAFLASDDSSFVARADTAVDLEVCTWITNTEHRQHGSIKG
jgi:NAD(P)-dependent dehydrogenase (short-subunit alcohol dehydrogenase family)